MQRRTALPTIVLAATVGLIAGCADTGTDNATITAADPVFAGLDPAVVAEVLASPVAEDRVAGDDRAAATARYQGMVRNVIACRSAHSVYQTWLETGTPPPFPHQPTPANPVSTAGDMDRDIERFRNHTRSGDISLLRDELTNETGCGSWIPVQPGDLDGPTIADAVSGRG